jgi:hypothetical protein
LLIINHFFTNQITFSYDENWICWIKNFKCIYPTRICSSINCVQNKNHIEDKISQKETKRKFYLLYNQIFIISIIVINIMSWSLKKDRMWIIWNKITRKSHWKNFEFVKKDFLKIHEKKQLGNYQHDYYFENMKHHCYYLRMKRNSLI